MSIGHIGIAHLEENEGEYILYDYGCWNLNLDNWQDHKNVCDGLLMIRREALVEPLIREKKVRTKSGRKKWMTKKVKRDFSVEEIYKAGDILIDNASGTWNMRENGIDMMAFSLLRKIFNEYQESGELPKTVYWMN